MKKLYLHTIKGRLAFYEKGQQIYYINPRRGLELPKYACKSLRQIKREQRLSNLWRDKRNFNSCLDYGHVIINLNEDEYNGDYTKK